MCSLVTYTMQLNPSLHVNFISDKMVLMCVKTHAAMIAVALIEFVDNSSAFFLPNTPNSSSEYYRVSSASIISFIYMRGSIGGEGPPGKITKLLVSLGIVTMTHP